MRFQVHVDQIFIWLRLLAKERVFKSVHFFLALTFGDVSSFFLRIFNSKHKFFKNFLYVFFLQSSLLRHVIFEIFCHTKAFEFLDPDYFLKLFVADCELLVLRVLQIILLDVVPQLFHHLVPRGLLRADDSRQVFGESQALGEASSALSLLLRLVRTRSCV